MNFISGYKGSVKKILVKNRMMRLIGLRMAPSFQTGPQELMYRHAHNEPKWILSASPAGEEPLPLEVLLAGLRIKLT